MLFRKLNDKIFKKILRMDIFIELYQNDETYSA